MPRPTADPLAKSVESLLSERRAVTAKERVLVHRLNRLLTKMGYEVVPRRDGQVVRRRRRRRGRPPAMVQSPRRKRRGRPRKKASAA